MRVERLFESIILAPRSPNLIEQSLLAELLSLLLRWFWDYLHGRGGVGLWRSLKCFKTV